MKRRLSVNRAARRAKAARWLKWAARVGVFGGITGGMALFLDPTGGTEAGPPAAVPQHLNIQGDTGTYTLEYEEQYGTCGLTRKDPINVVFTDWAYPSRVSLHAEDHGPWTVHTNGESEKQCFIDHGGKLLPQNDSNASNDGSWYYPDRFHMRYHVGTNANGGTDIDPQWNIYSVAAVHHEDQHFRPGCGHVIDHNDDNDGVSGFDMGRNNIYEKWVAAPGSHHQRVAVQYWDNIDRMLQCDGRESWSDGWVYFINVPLITGSGGGDYGRGFGFCTCGTWMW